MQKTRWMLALLSLVLVLGLGGCDDKPAQTRKARARKPQAVKPFDPAEREKQIKPREVLTYSRAGKRDPFRSLIKEVRKPTGRKARRKGLSPLELYDVTAFKLIGIVRGSGGNMAMLVTPDGKGFTVKAGMHVGLNNGEIKRITADAVEVVEMISNYRGEMVPQTVRLELRKEEEQ